MPAKRHPSALTMDQASLGTMIGRAWCEAPIITRRMPRAFAEALATLMELKGDQHAAFVNLIALEVQAIEQQRRRDGFGAV